MTPEVIAFFKGIDAVQAIIAIAAFIWILNFMVRKFFPGVAAVNEILVNLKSLEDIPKLKKDIEETKLSMTAMNTKIVNMEAQLKELVESNLLARGSENNGQGVQSIRGLN